jgi:hypothetical protein
LVDELDERAVEALLEAADALREAKVRTESSVGRPQARLDAERAADAYLDRLVPLLGGATVIRLRERQALVRTVRGRLEALDAQLAAARRYNRRKNDPMWTQLWREDQAAVNAFLADLRDSIDQAVARLRRAQGP